MKKFVAGAVIGIALAGAKHACAADLSAILAMKAPPPAAPAYDWTGFYVGAHIGYAGGTSNWTSAPGLGGSVNFFQPFDAFTGGGSYFGGIQAGYDKLLPNRFVLGAELDASFPTFPNLNGTSIGGTSTFNSPFGPESYSETVLSSGTLRGRIGYAPGQWLFYATAGFAWTYDQLTLTNLTTGTTDSPFLWRLGWAAGAGIEAPVAPHWTARLEYLFTEYGNSDLLFANAGQRFNSDLSLQELRAGLNYQFGADPGVTIAAAPGIPGTDQVNFHGQATFTWQGYPAIRSPYTGSNSLIGSGEGRETTDATLFAGLRLWPGAEFWIDPEIDQGFGLASTHGVAGFTSAEAYKVGADYPYTRLQRYFIRQTIDLGGDSLTVDADINQFAGSQTANRLVLTIGKFAIVDIFDTNKYANNPKNDFLNWSLVNAGTFDYAADAWAYTYGVAAEWYQGDWTLRGGAFDLSQTPTGGISPLGPNLDPTFDQFQLVGEIERRYQLWSEPGAIKVTGFLSRGRAGSYAAAIALAQATGMPADITAVRSYDSRPGVSVNWQQQITDAVGVFARAGWADGNIEPWDFTDIDRTVSAGASLNGKPWGRPDDTIGLAGVVNGISKIHQEFLNDGGLGILIGDGQLPNYGLEQIIETYYSYALSASTRFAADYQFVANPGYNRDRGPVNIFAGRFHWQF
ncbi:MAG TPA: carbohydrate porin [Xanthobacteraceae bacterium]|nr:carbohydrate porin [Xanthobacteraceae bacterium]